MGTPGRTDLADTVWDRPDLLEMLFARGPMGIAIFDREVRIQRGNPAWYDFIRRYVSASAAEALTPGTPYFSVFPEMEPEVRPLVVRVLTGEVVRAEGIRLRSHGRDTWWDVVLTPIYENGEIIGFMDVVNDANTRVQARQELEVRARQQAAVAALGQRALANADLNALFQATVETVRETLGIDCCAVMELDQAAGLLRSRSGRGWREDEVADMTMPADGDGLAAFTLRSAATVVVIDLAREDRFTEMAVMRSHGVTSAISVIVGNPAQPFGTLSAHSTTPRAFTRDDEHFLEAVANLLAVAVERARIENELREREAEYRGIFEAATDGLVISDLATGTMVAANPAYSAMHGYTPEEMIGLTPGDFVHPDSVGTLAAYHDAVRAGERFRGRAVDVRKDGTSFPISVQGTPFTFRGQPHVLGVLRDITELTRSYELLEERVAERTRELRTLLDISGSLTLTLDLPDLLQSILDRLRVVLDFTGASIFLLEDDALTLLEYQGDLPRAQLASAWPLERAQHAQAVIMRREPVILADVYADEPLAAAWRAQTVNDLGELPETVGTWMGAPMLLRDDVIGILAVDHPQAGAYGEQHAGLLLTVANLAAAAIENARLYTEALGKAALEERQRLARELHDSVSQALYGIALGARTARTLLDRDPALVADPLDYVLNLADAGLTEMRALIFALRPESLEREGLSAALARQADALRARYGIAVHAAICDEPDVSLAVKEALSRITQEALHNVVKHSNAQSVDLRLAQGDGALTLVISDDGVGFDPAEPHLGHLGLRSMRERIAALHGSIEVESAPACGARLTVRVPVMG